jgi:hypothetical protein
MLVAALVEIKLLDAEADADSSESYSVHRDHTNRRAADADADVEHNLIEEMAVLIPETDEEPTLPRTLSDAPPAGRNVGCRGRSQGGMC